MIPESLHPHQLLSWMAIPSYPGTYILGSFARHVTIYSQQMRAFNLIDALCKTGQLSNGLPVAVVGGGIAGLTAAAAATVRGAEVTVIERESDFFPIQRRASKRYLHPHIYDWPLYELREEQDDRADFPFLGWEAGNAQEVFEKLARKWRDFCAGCKGMKRPKELMGTEFTGLVYKQDGRYLEATVRQKNHSEPMLIQAQIVVLALGFGREFERPDIQKYWDDDPSDSTATETRKYLVSGSGDGGLTDLMRLCIKDFYHDRFVKKFARDSNLAQGLHGLLIESRGTSVRAAFEELYKDLNDSALIKDSDLRTDTEVTLNAPDNYLESNGSSILNRFIVFQLEQLKKFTRQDGRMPSPLPQLRTSNKYEVTFHNENKDVPDVFDRLIIRHGPERSLSEKNFPAIWEASAELCARWEGQSQSNDRTRVQIWDPADYDLSKAPNPIMIEDRPDGAVDLCCLILESTNRRDEGPLHELIEAAVNGNIEEINRALGRKQSEDIKPDFEDLNVNVALSSQKEYNRAVRALCKADVAVIDVTDYEPGVMLFLGIRSAVRRGVTLVTTNHKLDTAGWSKLPFNLKELYPLSVWPRTSDINSPEHPNGIIGATVARALGEYRSSAFYQDLPTYEAVRRFEATPKLGAQSILWLCSFDEKYRPYENYIQNGFTAEYGLKKTEGNQNKYRLERITEIISPQLVAQRLYSAIRRTGLCLVDWSFWSPNVFFEFGVRIAVSSMGTVCLLGKGLKDSVARDHDKNSSSNDEPTPEALKQREALKKLFHPIEYGQPGEAQKLFQHIRARQQEIQDYEAPGRTSSPIPPTFGAFVYNHTYKLVGRYLPLGNEPGASAAHELLKTAADALIGVTTTTDPSLPVLYANVNNNLNRQVRGAATELLIAAWYYLHNRCSDEVKQQGDLPQSYTDLGRRLLDLLGWSDDPKDKILCKEVEETLDMLEELKSRGGSG